MPDVTVEEVVPVPVERMWELVADVEAYPRLIEHVRALEVLERGPKHRVTAWTVDLRGCVMRWVEHEQLDAARHRIDYHQVGGDLQRFEGHWQLDPAVGASTRVVLAVRFEIGIPALSEMLDPVAERAIRASSRSMVLSLATAAVEEARCASSSPIASPSSCVRAGRHRSCCSPTSRPRSGSRSWWWRRARSCRASATPAATST